jgi:hypothetical protein
MIMTVLIAGGGIGGLTLALSLHQIGVPAKVFESVSELKPLGVGINVLPHAVRELIELGLLYELGAAGVRTRELAYFSKHGKPIWSEPAASRPGTNGRNSPSTAARCSRSCWTLRSNGWDQRTFSPAIISVPGRRRQQASAPTSSTSRPESPSATTRARC